MLRSTITPCIITIKQAILVRTVPPKGVQKLDPEQLELVREDRANGKKTVHTEHTMATTYAYNSLGQLVKQNVPDHNDLDLFEAAEQSNLYSGLPSNFEARDVAFTSKLNGVAVGYIDLNGGGKEGQIYLTQDGGKFWQKANSAGTEEYNFISPERHIVGASGKLLVYTNNQWYRKVTPTNENLIHIQQASGNTLHITAQSGKRWTSTDLGDSWSPANDDLQRKSNASIKENCF